MLDNENQEIFEILQKLSKSKFRNSFHLKMKDYLYIKEKGLATIRSHARDFINKRLASSYIKNDGKQTPTHGHPVFIAQHATATCCRGCLEKWHHIKKGYDLKENEKEYIENVIMEWIKGELNNEK